MDLLEIHKKRVLVQGLVIIITAIGLLAYSAGLKPVFASHSVKDLPGGVVKLTPSIPTMGEHWANLDDMPLGPIWGVYQGKVIFVEFMYSQEMLKEIRIPTPGGEEIFYELANLEVDHAADHVDIGFVPKGHEGFEVPHYDIHVWFVSHDLHMLIPGEAPPQE